MDSKTTLWKDKKLGIFYEKDRFVLKPAWCCISWVEQVHFWQKNWARNWDN
jgi:hypothetical protein